MSIGKLRPERRSASVGEERLLLERIGMFVGADGFIPSGSVGFFMGVM